MTDEIDEEELAEAWRLVLAFAAPIVGCPIQRDISSAPRYVEFNGFITIEDGRPQPTQNLQDVVTAARRASMN
jgi:hypothetical protein